MALNKQQMTNILKELGNLTLQEKLSWYSEGEHLYVDLPSQMRVDLTRTPVGGLTVNIRRGSAEILGSIEFAAADLENGANEIKTLYEAASSMAGRIVYSEIMDAIKLSDSASAELVRKAPSVLGVPAEQKAKILKKMAGKWNLDYSRGKEKAVIADDGSYFVNGTIKFQLEVLAENEETSTVEVAKDTLDGRRYQIEYLRITPDSMTGYAKHDGHKLNYTRVKS